MTVEEVLRRVADEVEVLKLRLWGHLQDLASGHGRRRSFVTKLTKSKTYRFARLIEVLEICGEDPAAFFARALDIRPDPDAFLRELQRPGEECAALERIEKVTRRVELEDPPAGEPSRARPLLEDLTRSSRSDQRKRLRSTKKFQTEEFLRQYLVYVDDLRYESPQDSAFLAETLAQEVVAKMIAPREVRIELQCEAIGIFGSAHRKLGNYTTASRAILLALERARLQGLEEIVAKLQMRGAYLLSDHGLHERAVALLESAQITFSDLEDDVGQGKALVLRGITVGLQGKYRLSLGILQRALVCLPESDKSLDRWRLTAFHGAGIAHLELGDLDSAETWLNEGVETTSAESGPELAYVFWLRGKIAFRKGDKPRAERYLLRTLRALKVRNNATQLVSASLDLLSVLLAQNRFRQASSLASQSAALIQHLKGNRLATAVVMKLSQAGLAGSVSQALVDELTEELEKGARRDARAPRRQSTAGFDIGSKPGGGTLP